MYSLVQSSKPLVLGKMEIMLRMSLYEEAGSIQPATDLLFNPSSRGFVDSHSLKPT